MYCNNCRNNIIDDALTICPVCNKSLINSQLKPAAYDPAEDASVPVSAYMTATPEVVSKIKKAATATAKAEVVKKAVKKTAVPVGEKPKAQRKIRRITKQAVKEISKDAPAQA